MINPNPLHGNKYRVLFFDKKGIGTIFDLVYNGYEFNSPFTQACHEAKVICQRNNTQLRSIFSTPI